MEAGHFFFFLNLLQPGFFENIKNKLNHSLVQSETVRQLAPYRQILHMQTEQRYRSKLAVHSQHNGHTNLYLDLNETQIKTTLAKQLNSFANGRNAGRLKRLRNRDDQK